MTLLRFYFIYSPFIIFLAFRFCGDGTKFGSEECDDGNTIEGKDFILKL